MTNLLVAITITVATNTSEIKSDRLIYLDNRPRLKTMATRVVETTVATIEYEGQRYPVTLKEKVLSEKHDEYRLVEQWELVPRTNRFFHIGTNWIHTNDLILR